MKVKMTKTFKCYLNETEYNDLEKNQEIDVNEKDYNFLVNKKGVAELVKVVKKEDPEENNPEEKAEVPKKGRKAGRKPRK